MPWMKMPGKKARGPLKKTRGYRGSVGCREHGGRVYLSLCQSVFLSASKPFLPWLFPTSLLLHVSKRQGAGKTQGGQQEARSGHKGSRAQGQAVTGCSVLERQDWSGAKVADQET